MAFPCFMASGCDSAWKLSRVFARNLKDLAAKVDDGTRGDYEKGFFHTSTEPAPGTNYYTSVWSRDGGRGMIELACLGFAAEALDVARYFAGHLNAGDHWSRTIQGPADDDRVIELDGNALALLGIHNAWRVNGRRRDVAEELLPACLKVAGWAQEQAERSPYGDLLPCVSEMTGNPCSRYPVYGVFPNVGMMLALHAVADMTESVDASQSKAVRSLAERIGESIRTRLVAGDGIRTCTPEGCWINGLDGRDGSVYDNAEWEGLGFPVFHWTRQLPFILLSDCRSLDLSTSPFSQVDQASYDYLLHEMCRGRHFRKYGFVSNTCWTGMADRHDETMAGYGQGFFTQASLMTDTVNAYTLCLEGYARLAYDGSVCEPLTHERDPWVIHECFNYENYEEGHDHTFGRLTGNQPGGMDNPGDEGNLVQMAEGLKAFRIVVGIEDFDLRAIRIMPRLPWTWDSLEVRDYPITGPDGQGKLHYSAVNDLARGMVSLEYESDLKGLEVSLRLGPIPRSVPVSFLPGEVVENRWARWVWFHGLRSEGGKQEIQL